MQQKILLSCVFLLLSICWIVNSCQNPCYSNRFENECPMDEGIQTSYTLHMSVHPHLDAYWIFNLESYYDPKPNQGDVHSYFRSNRFHSVKQIFDTATQVLTQSKTHRQKFGKGNQKSHRSFFNSQMGFFKKWYTTQDKDKKNKVKQLLKTKYWQIVGGGFVQHDQGCAYYDDIITNFQTGLSFLKEQFNYFPKAAISADSFGHSQTTLAILAHLGIEGFFVQRSDEHVLLQNKTQFIWKAKSANGQYYGALPTHIRWAIHGFEDQFIGSNPNEQFCQTKQNYINNMRRQNQFLKRILKSPHIMRYFGHDFQKFDDYSYKVIQGIMEKFSTEKCNKVVAVYGNPTEYFITLMAEVFGQKKKPIATKQEDIMPIWDYDSGLYWTGYYTTDPYHKKNYRDIGRFLYGVQKFLTPSYFIKDGAQTFKKQYQELQILAQQVSYLQHHDGISGTSKYTVMDQLQKQNQQMISNVRKSVLKKIFDEEFDSVQAVEKQSCIFGIDCKLRTGKYPTIYLKVLNSAGYKRSNEPIIVKMPYETYYQPNCPYEMNCFCQQLPCDCSLYLYPEEYGSYLYIKLTKKQILDEIKTFKILDNTQNKMFNYNFSHFKIELNDRKYSIGYKKIIAQGTNRRYKHLSRYGDGYERSFNIRPGKYALGNNPNKIQDLTSINKVLFLQSKRNYFILIKWNRQMMKTLISINKAQNNEWKVETLSAAEAYHLQDLYLQVQTEIQNNNQFYTDSNGWLVLKRQLFKHQDYQAHFDTGKFDDIDGNSYPITAFTYIEDRNQKVSINTDRPQGVISYKPGTIWVNFDRLSSDDGKWVYQNTFRGDYQRFTHVITVQNTNNNQRKIQSLYDMPIFCELSFSQLTDFTPQQKNHKLLNEWRQYSGLNNLKTTMKPLNDSTLLVRVQNLNDKQNKQVKLFAGNVSPLLTAFYGNQVVLSKVQQRSLGNNMNYEEFLNKKWNWNSVIDLDKQNNIFNKQFGSIIKLRPLQIRTFLFYGVNFTQQCGSTQNLKISQNKILYVINKTKDAPKRQDPVWQRQALQYLQNGDKCNSRSPINIDKKYQQAIQKNQQNHHIDQLQPKKPNIGEVNIDDFFKPLQPVDIQDNNQIKKQQSLPEDNRPVKQQQIKKQQPIVPPKKQQFNSETPKKEDASHQDQSKPVDPKTEFLQIRRKVLDLKILTHEQKEKYFKIRLQQIQESLSKKINK